MISVIIPTHRRPQLLKRAIRSVLRQTFRDLEVIVVIDGSDSETRSLVSDIPDQRLSVVETGQNQGPAAARNYGVQLAQGVYVSFLDDDDEWTEEKLETQVAMIHDHRLTGEFLIGCRLLCKPTDGEPFISPSDSFPGGEVSDYLMNRRSLFKPPGQISTATFLCPRSLLLRVPFPHEQVFEDWSWLLICTAREQIPLFICPAPMYVYHLDSLAVSRSKSAKWQLGIDWSLRHRQYMTGRAFSGWLSTAIARRAKQQKAGLRAMLGIARLMWSHGDPTIVHWAMMTGVALTPLSFVEFLRRRNR